MIVMSSCIHVPAWLCFFILWFVCAGCCFFFFFSLSLSIWILSPTNCSFLENKSTQLFFKFEFLNMILSSRIILFFILLFKDVFFFLALNGRKDLG